MNIFLRLFYGLGRNINLRHVCIYLLLLNVAFKHSHVDASKTLGYFKMFNQLALDHKKVL